MGGSLAQRKPGEKAGKQECESLLEDLMDITWKWWGEEGRSIGAGADKLRQDIVKTIKESKVNPAEFLRFLKERIREEEKIAPPINFFNEETFGKELNKTTDAIQARIKPQIWRNNEDRARVGAGFIAMLHSYDILIMKVLAGEIEHVIWGELQ
jgi:hypothetical protein